MLHLVTRELDPLSVLPAVSWLIASLIPSSSTCRASSRSDQLPYLSGGGPRRSAISRNSCSPSRSFGTGDRSDRTLGTPGPERRKSCELEVRCRISAIGCKIRLDTRDISAIYSWWQVCKGELASGLSMATIPCGWAEMPLMSCVWLRTGRLAFAAALLSSTSCQNNGGMPAGRLGHDLEQRELPAAVANKVDPEFQTPRQLQMAFTGFVGSRLAANLEGWELRTPGANPALTEMFYDRDRKPPRDLLPWHGEFVGKYLCSAILSHRILRDPRQEDLIQRVASRFIASQGEDGYLGPFPEGSRLTGLREGEGFLQTQLWDVWGHYWAIQALILYYEDFGDEAALAAATKAADLIVQTFLHKPLDMTNDGSVGQMNYAVIHAFALLYRITGKRDYLDMAYWIIDKWDEPAGPQYMKLALNGNEMYEFPGNRWESLHDFLGLYEMYLLTGEPTYREVFVHIWNSILKGDRHNTGGFSSGEKTTGNPYDPSAIETCCTVAWIDMSIAMLKLTGNSLVADEIELSTFNGSLGGQSPSGRWWTYNTPMNGTKEASAHTINFQCRPGSPELNCCSVNGPRGLALLSEWAVLSNDGPVLNYYGPSTFWLKTPNSQTLVISQQTDYPRSGNVILQLTVDEPEQFPIKIRIPSWSATTSVSVNGEKSPDVRQGSYLHLERQWKTGDIIELNLDMSPHYWVGERNFAAEASVYHGPILLAFDPVYNDTDPAAIPQIDAKTLNLEAGHTTRNIQPWMILTTQASDGTQVALCDFASAGAYGNYYRTWLPLQNIAPLAFSRDKPVWTNRP